MLDVEGDMSRLNYHNSQSVVKLGEQACYGLRHAGIDELWGKLTRQDEHTCVSTERVFADDL